MQRSQSMHSSSSSGDLEIVSNGSSQSLTSPNRTTAISRTASTSAAAIDILDVPLKPYPINDKQSKPNNSSKFRKETYVHSIPLIVFVCYFCLWIISSSPGPDAARSTHLEQ